METNPTPNGAENTASATDKFVVVASSQQELDEARAALAGVPGVRFELVESGQNGGLNSQAEGGVAAPKPADNGPSGQAEQNPVFARIGESDAGDQTNGNTAGQVADENQSGAPLDDIGADQNPPPVSDPENLEQPRGRVR